MMDIIPKTYSTWRRGRRIRNDGYHSQNLLDMAPEDGASGVAWEEA